MPLALALAPAPPDLAPLPVALAPAAEVLAATSPTLTSRGPLEATRTPWRLPHPARRRPNARPLCCSCPNGATCRRDPSVPASRQCVWSSLIEPPRRSRTMKSDGRVFLPRAPPAARHAQGSRPADPDQPCRIRALGTGADALVRGWQPEGHPETSDYPRRPHPGAVRADAADQTSIAAALGAPPRLPQALAAGAAG